MDEGLKRVPVPPMFKKEIDDENTVWLRCTRCDQEWTKLDMGLCPPCKKQADLAAGIRKDPRGEEA